MSIRSSQTRSRPARSWHLILELALFTLALVLRVGWVIHSERAPQYPDSQGYQAVAESLLCGQGFTIKGQTQHNRPPLYPLLWAAVWEVTPRELLALLLVQAGFSALSVLIVYRTVWRMTDSSRSGFAAGLIMALDPFQIFFCGLALSETLYLFLLVLAINRICAACPFTGGLVTGLAALTKAVGLPHAAALGAAVLFDPGRTKRQPLIWLCSYLFGLVVTIAPWTYRNYLVYGELVPITIGSGFTLYESNNPLFSDGPWPSGLAVPPPPPRVFPIEADRYYASQARTFIAQNPREFLARAFRRQGRLFDPFPHATPYAGGTYALVSAVVMIPLYVLSLIGFLRLNRRSRLILGLPILATMAVHVFILGSVRYRLPLMPVFAMLAGTALGPRPVEEADS